MSDPPDLDARIARARDRLAAKLGELQHRVTETRRMLSPRTYLENPWVQLGVGALVGYLFGRGPRKRLTAGDGASVTAPRADGFVIATLKSSALALATATIRRAIAGALDEPAVDAPAKATRDPDVA